MLLYITSSSPTDEETSRYPWQVTRLADGRHRVFGLTVGTTTAKQAMRQMRREPEIIIYEHNGDFSVEAYFGKYNRAGISGVVIAVLGATDTWVEEAATRAVKKERTSEGGTKLSLASRFYREALLLKIVSLTYIPSVRLDDKIVRNRFGEPSSMKSTADGRTHYGYSARGIIVSLNPAGKTIVTYTEPESYQKAMKSITGR